MSKNKCVMKEWTYKLSWKEQTVLISALRGCDGVGKHDISKKIVRRIRSAVLNNAGTKECEFMHSEITEQEIKDFSKNIDAYPIHFLLHIIHASEVIGYCCSIEKEKQFFREFYNIMVSSFHMMPESEECMHLRLKDGVDTCCHKT